MIRALEPRDIEELREIHDKFFKHEFPFPDFFKGFLCCFAITDDTDGSIVSVGALRSIAEVFAISDKDKSNRIRRKAYFDSLEALSHMAQINGYDQLHAFVQEPKWEELLIRVGFYPTKGKSLVYNI